MFLYRGEQREALKTWRAILIKELAQDANIPALSKLSKLTRTPFWPDTPVPADLLPVGAGDQISPTWKQVAEEMVNVINYQLGRKVKRAMVETIT